MIVQLTDDKGNFELEIPLYLSEITLGEYISFLKKRAKHLDLLVNDEVNHQLNLVTESLTELISELVSGELTRLPLGKDVVEEFVLDIGYDGELTLLHIYTHILNLIENYESGEIPKTYLVNWYDENGEAATYYIEPDRAKRLSLGTHYTTGEYFELEEYKRKIKRQVALKGDTTGRFAFTLALSQLAILLRKEGEALPHQKQLRTKFVQRRRKIFEKLPATVYLDVYFFLRNTLEDWSKQPITDRFSNHPKNQVTSVKRLLKRRQKVNGYGTK